MEFGPCSQGDKILKSASPEFGGKGHAAHYFLPVMILSVFFAVAAASGAAPRTPISLHPDDVLPTGNQWISLPDIRAGDGSLGTFNVLSMRHRGLLQVSGDRGGPVIQPYFTANGKPLDFHNPSWELIAYWIPTAHLTIAGLDATLTWCAPPDSRCRISAHDAHQP